MSEAVKFLVVDDDNLNLRILKEALSDEDYSITTLTSGEECLEQIETIKPDILLLDVMMPGVDGLEVCRQIRKNPELNNINILLLSAKAMNKERVEGYKAGADDYITKPFDIDELRYKIKVYIRLKYVQEKERILKQDNDQITRFNHGLLRLKAAEKLLNANGDITWFYQQLINNLAEITQAKYGAFGIFDDNKTLNEFITLGVSPEAMSELPSMPAGKGLLRAIYDTKELTLINCIKDDPRSIGFPAGHPAMTSLLAMPLRVNGVTRGVLYLSDKNNGKPFSDTDRTSMLMYAMEVTHVLQRHDMMGEMKKANAAIQKDKEDQQVLIRELHEAKNQLLQSEKMASIGQLAAGVAHEINNPVGYIDSNLRSLSRYLDDMFFIIDAYEELEPLFKDEQHVLDKIQNLKKTVDVPFLKQDMLDLVKESQEGTERVKQIVQDLKNFSHVDEAEWQWSDLHKGINSTLNIVHNELKYKAEIIKNYGDIPEVECMVSQLNQVFMNLLVNAGHAIEDRGTISINTGMHNENMVYIEICDTGKGISKDDLNRIFDPFFTTKPVGKGTGLGLSLSYGIVQKHGGSIELESEVGKGTTFRILVPVQQENSQAEGVAV